MRGLKTERLILWSALASGVLLISNIVAVKLWTFAGVAIDGGIVLFPLTYIIGDLIVEFYGRKLANKVIWASLMVNILAILTFMGVSVLPPHPDWHGQEAFGQILGFVPRIVIGSLIAYLVSQLVNNLVFEKIKQKTGERGFLVRALGSSLISKLFDIVIFEIIAFYGVLPFKDFLGQMVVAYLAGILLEVILSPITVGVVKLIKRRDAEI